MKIRKYLQGKENIILLITALGVILIIIRDLPFLNIIFPYYTTPSILFVLTSVLFKWYKSLIFYIFWVIFISLFFFTGDIVQAEQLTILIFVILAVNIGEQMLSLFRNG